MKLPFISQLFKALVRPPETNPFPAPHLPPSVSAFLDDAAKNPALLSPPVPVPPGGRSSLDYDPAACLGCRLCIKVCPAHAIEFLPETKKISLNRARCVACGQCTEVCAKHCLTISKNFLLAETDPRAPALTVQ